MDKIIYKIWALSAFGAGSAALYELSEEYEDTEELYNAVNDPACLPEKLRSRFSAQLKRAAGISLDNAEKVADFCDRNNISMIANDSELYPESLRNIYHPPILLFVKGDISGLGSNLSIAMVGARHPSQYSLKIASSIVRTLTRAGFDIISGFAEGIDICSQLTAVKMGGKSYAVLGAGIDLNYPKPNFRYRELIEQNGALITEYLPGTNPYPSNFPFRNRILTGLSMGVAIVEARLNSGSINSASHAADQGKSVFTVPPADICDPRYLGNAELIRQGAIPLMGARDIYNEYCDVFSHTIADNARIEAQIQRLRDICGDANDVPVVIKSPRPAVKPDGETLRKISKKAADAQRASKKSEAENVKETAEIPQELSGNERNVFEFLTKGGAAADDISDALELDLNDILEAVTSLEITGYITAANGKYIIK